MLEQIYYNMSNMVTKTDLQELRNQLIHQVSVIEKRLDTTQIRIDELEKLILTSPASEATIQIKLDTLEKQISELRTSGAKTSMPESTDTHSCTLVIGGLDELKNEEECGPLAPLKAEDT